ncbi:hypothetical protein ES703_66511 [subsurface metagenome]
MNELISQSLYQLSEDFVFYGECRDKPLNNKTILRTLYKALENIGIKPEERKRRNLNYHSWRHTFNTLMRGKIPDAKLQRLTGHRNVRILENYTHFSIDDFKDVLMIQEKYFIED